ncbi:MAG: D-isomer specific 2-hydroxyacid dehydrogenase NAD-binding protein [Dehalococcoidales bacterium]|nr:D-isomer specific 2-hydroxyacid dehydrogenase NAD-binding protein [Dehalococcoidales bacterium]
MDTLNVVIIPNIPEEHLRKIEATDPRLRLKRAGPLFRVARQVEQEKGKATPEQAAVLKELENMMREAEVLYALRLPDNLAQRSPRLKWVQLISAGVESAQESRGLSSNVVLTNATGGNSAPVAEQVFGFMLMFVKQSRRSWNSQVAHKWDNFISEELYDKTIGIIGLGHVGEDIAKRAHAFQMKLLIYDPYVSAGRLNRLKAQSADVLSLMKESDFIAVTVPLTPETTKMIGEAQFRAMKKTAFFINTSRGRVIDQTALIKALKEGWIAGAAIDVTDPEPLPPESELWDTPNLIISPHVAGNTYGMGVRTVQLFCENIKRYLAGKKLINTVDRTKGY